MGAIVRSKRVASSVANLLQIFQDNTSAKRRAPNLLAHGKSLYLQRNLVPLFLFAFKRRKDTSRRGHIQDLLIGLIGKLVNHEHGEDLQLHQAGMMSAGVNLDFGVLTRNAICEECQC